jgi:hypothetical protein
MQVMTIEQIKLQYPDQWVLIGNPEFKNPDLAPLVTQLLHGTVLIASKDKREVALRASEVKQGYDGTACIWTGTFPKKRHKKCALILKEI